MNELTIMVQILLALAMTAGTFLLVTRAISSTSELIDGLPGPASTGAVHWPRGVQEEEPRRWNLGSPA
jgi:hypothetical protein